MRRVREKTYRLLTGLVLMMAVVIASLSMGPMKTVEAFSEDAVGYFLWDEAVLLTESEDAALEEACQQLSLEYNINVLVVTTEDFGGGDILDWELDVLTQSGMGLEDPDGGVILAVSMADRDWGIQTYGAAEEAFNTYGREMIGRLIVSDLSDGDYYDAFTSFVSMSEEFLLANSEGTPYSESNPYGGEGVVVVVIFASFILSLIISTLILLSWKRGMNTRVKQDAAAEYLDEDSFELTNSSDIFLYTTVTKTEKSKNDSDSMSSTDSGTSGKF